MKQSLWHVIWVAVACLLMSAMTNAAEKSKLVVLMWNAEPGEATRVQEIYSRFTDKYPEVDLDMTMPSGNYFEKAQTMIASGAQLDVVTIYPFAAGEWVAGSMFQDLTPYIQRDRISLNVFPRPIVDAFQVGNVTWGMPTDAGAIVTYYNEDLFAAAGLHTPHDLDQRKDWNWQSFLDAAKRLTVDKNGDGIPDQYGVDYYIDLSRYIHWVWSNGGRLFDRTMLPTKATFGDPKSVEGLRFFLDLQMTHKVVKANGFDTGESAMQLNQGPWYVQRIVNLPGGGNNIGAAKLPGNVRQVTSLWPNGYQIARSAKNPEMAWEFIKFITLNADIAAAFSQATGRTPVLQTVFRSRFLTEPPPTNKQVLMEAFSFGEIAPVSPAMHRIRTQIAPKYINQVLSGAMALETAAASIDREAGALLQEMGATTR
jgi:multiple sugar transport system substrate-binding protein